MGRPPATTGAENASNAGRPGGAASEQLGTPAPSVRRAEAFACGRLFQETRVSVCELALNPQADLEDVLVRGLVPRLVAAAAAMSAGTERDLELWLHELRREVCGVDRVEELVALQCELDAMTPYRRPDFDLIALRARQLRPYHEAFDRRRAEVGRGLAGPVVDAFRLGELIESGALPDARLRPADPDGEPEVPGRVALRFGCDMAVDQVDRDRLVLCPPRRRRFDFPWHLSWPDRVRAEWWIAGLREPPEGTLLGADDHPPGPDRRQAVYDKLVATASRLLGERYTPRVELRDRLRIVDAGAQLVELDGRTFVIESPRGFAIFDALFTAPSRQLTTEEARGLEGCKSTDVSREIKAMPGALRDIIHSSNGTNAFYYFRLPPLPGVGDGRGGG